MTEAPDADEWAAWKEHPVTRFVDAGLRRIAAARREQALAMIWELPGDLPVPAVMDLNRAKLRAETYLELADLSFEDALGANGMEPPTNAG